MQVHALLENRKVEIQAEMEKLRNELAEIDRMLGVRTANVSPVKAKALTVEAADIPDFPPQTKDDAIVDAIKAGNRTPATIAQFIRERLGVEVNDASTRTRLSRMKSAGKIGHDAYGWKLS
ncbi:hypothetical protein G6M87_11040 [Rhizobium rhizogenes]|uniref:hypothetical protein n=1 Tax=Rhizobium rhizogenes TaxID=359 RepID=UPI001572F34A|nr:hypothetical protein [Rhizobium rhizogenes]NTI22393.1 hypothetical protein [Rhizobium rhizogenes]QTG05978.1 hypothetical protein G6M87_11040 [Rhizobium rhizogenes]